MLCLHGRSLPVSGNSKVMGSRLLRFVSWGGIITPQKDPSLFTLSYHLPLSGHFSFVKSPLQITGKEKSRALNVMFETSAQTGYNVEYVILISLYDTSVELFSLATLHCLLFWIILPCPILGWVQGSFPHHAVKRPGIVSESGLLCTHACARTRAHTLTAIPAHGFCPSIQNSFPMKRSILSPSFAGLGSVMQRRQTSFAEFKARPD